MCCKTRAFAGADGRVHRLSVFSFAFVEKNVQKKNSFPDFGVDFRENMSRMLQPDFSPEGNKKGKKKTMKTIAIVLGLAAFTAVGNTLPPTPENTLPPTPECGI